MVHPLNFHETLGPTGVRCTAVSRGAGRAAQGFVLALALVAMIMAARSVPAHAAAVGSPVWMRLELVENSVEGPAFDRCQIETTLESGRTTRWRVYYGEARADSTGWAAIRSGSGCAPASPERSAAAWTLRGSPYFLVDMALGQTRVSGREVLIEADFSVQKLTGFGRGGAPEYETKTEKRTLRAPEGSSAVIPILVASQKEIDSFGVRELLLKFRASVAGAGKPVEYGEIAVMADVPRAEILLDGGLVGRTSSDGPVQVVTVRVGEREIVVRDASGREARAVARVEKGRRANVSLIFFKEPVVTVHGLRPLGRNPQGGEEFWREKDGAIVVRIPGGEFQMGSPENEGQPAEHPQHAVRLKGFLMDKTEVTWGQYRRFAKESGQPLPSATIWGTPEAFPVSNVTWDQAGAFCAWAGGRLPTEAEWERAARSDDSRRYPWGNDWDPWRCNTEDGGPHAPTAAGAYPNCASTHGVLDLVGSVSEWVSDWYDTSYYSRSPADNPTGPETGALRAVRGGAWMSASYYARVTDRQGTDPSWPRAVKGFRCVQDDRKGTEK